MFMLGNEINPAVQFFFSTNIVLEPINIVRWDLNDCLFHILLVRYFQSLT